MRLSVIALLALNSLTARAGISQQVSARLTPFTTLHGTFVEEKSVAGLTKPLRSVGRLVYHKQRGLLWLVDKPVQSETVMTSTTLVQRVRGRVTTRLDVAAQPSMQIISRLFVAALTGDWAALDKDFEFRGTLEPHAWVLVLTPKGGLFAKFARKLEISGNTSVEKVVLFELTGDTSSTVFENQRLNEPLTPDEEARLDAK